MQKKIKRKNASYTRTVTSQYTKASEQRMTAGSEKTIKQLLGELYGDRQYLEKLLKETDPHSEMGKTISTLVTEGLSFLDTRSDFWRQQKPMYARRHERIMQRRRREASSNKISPNDYILRELEKIDQAQVEGRYNEALKRSQKCLSTVQGFTEDEVPNKLEVIANLHSCIGNAYLEMGVYDKALDSHQTDLNLGETHDMMEAVSRGLDNIGRVHARRGAFAEAIEVWERKLPMSKSPLETTWLYHEIGRCYLELDNFTEAKRNGEQSETAAIEASDQMWQLQALVLTAQAEVKLAELTAAVTTFEKASELAKAQGDKSAETAIRKAIDEINIKIIADGLEAQQIESAPNENSNGNAQTAETKQETKTETPVDKKETESAKVEETKSKQEDKPAEKTPSKEPSPRKEPSPAGDRDETADTNTEEPSNDQPQESADRQPAEDTTGN